MTETGVTAVLRRNDQDVTAAVQFGQWILDTNEARATVTFGPYPQTLHASGIRVLLDGAYDDLVFGDELALPAGQTYRYTLRMGVD